MISLNFVFEVRKFHSVILSVLLWIYSNSWLSFFLRLLNCKDAFVSTIQIRITSLSPFQAVFLIYTNLPFQLANFILQLFDLLCTWQIALDSHIFQPFFLLLVHLHQVFQLFSKLHVLFFKLFGLPLKHILRSLLCLIRNQLFPVKIGLLLIDIALFVCILQLHHIDLIMPSLWSPTSFINLQTNLAFWMSSQLISQPLIESFQLPTFLYLSLRLFPMPELLWIFGWMPLTLHKFFKVGSLCH